jgi:hypothetical protein
MTSIQRDPRKQYVLNKRNCKELSITQKLYHPECMKEAKEISINPRPRPGPRPGPIIPIIPITPKNIPSFGPAPGVPYSFQAPGSYQYAPSRDINQGLATAGGVFAGGGLGTGGYLIRQGLQKRAYNQRLRQQGYTRVPTNVEEGTEFDNLGEAGGQAGQSVEDAIASSMQETTDGEAGTQMRNLGEGGRSSNVARPDESGLRFRGARPVEEPLEDVPLEDEVGELRGVPRNSIMSSVRRMFGREPPPEEPAYELIPTSQSAAELNEANSARTAVQQSLDDLFQEGRAATGQVSEAEQAIQSLQGEASAQVEQAIQSLEADLTAVQGEAQIAAMEAATLGAEGIVDSGGGVGFELGASASANASSSVRGAVGTAAATQAADAADTLIDEATAADAAADATADVAADVTADVAADVAADVTADVAADVVADVGADVIADAAAEAAASAAADAIAEATAAAAASAAEGLAAEGGFAAMEAGVLQAGAGTDLFTGGPENPISDVLAGAVIVAGTIGVGIASLLGAGKPKKYQGINGTSVMSGKNVDKAISNITAKLQTETRGTATYNALMALNNALITAKTNKTDVISYKTEQGKPDISVPLSSKQLATAIKVYQKNPNAYKGMDKTKLEIMGLSPEMAKGEDGAMETSTGYVPKVGTDGKPFNPIGNWTNIYTAKNRNGSFTSTDNIDSLAIPDLEQKRQMDDNYIARATSIINAESDPAVKNYLNYELDLFKYNNGYTGTKPTPVPKPTLSTAQQAKMTQLTDSLTNKKRNLQVIQDSITNKQSILDGINTQISNINAQDQERSNTIYQEQLENYHLQANAYNQRLAQSIQQTEQRTASQNIMYARATNTPLDAPIGKYLTPTQISQFNQALAAGQIKTTGVVPLTSVTPPTIQTQPNGSPVVNPNTLQTIPVK